VSLFFSPNYIPFLESELTNNQKTTNYMVTGRFFMGLCLLSIVFKGQSDWKSKSWKNKI
jgi:hypothetical protein